MQQYFFPVVVCLSNRQRPFYRKVRENGAVQAAIKAFFEVDVLRARSVGREAIADRGSGKKNLIAVADGELVRRFEELNGNIKEVPLEEHKKREYFKDFMSVFQMATSSAS